MSTELAIDGIKFPASSARGLTQSLTAIEQSKQSRRTINGALKDTAVAQFKKYKVSISCSDMNVPAFNGVWPGKSVVVDCVTELSYVTIGGSADRTVVAGSSRVVGLFTFYRPQLTMMVLDFTIDEDDYGKVVGWTIELEEI